jgi:hypothetical protein
MVDGGGPRGVKDLAAEGGASPGVAEMSLKKLRDLSGVDGLNP